MGDAVAGEGVMTHNRRNTLGAVLVLLVIALTTSGCIVESGRSEQSRAIGEKVSCPVKPDPGIRTTARIGYQEVTNGDLIVKDTSLLRACMPNAKITWSKFSSGGDVLQGFKARSLDIALLGSAPAARALSAPLDIDMKVVWIQDVIGKAESLVVHDPAIRTLDQLRGKKIAVPFASTSHFSLLTALNRAGITDQVTLMNTQPDAMLAAWGNGIDAAWVWDPVLSKLKANGHVIDDSGVTAEQGAPTFDLEGARSDFVAQNGPFLKYWTVAQNWAVNLLNTDKQKAAIHIASQLSISPDQVTPQLAGYKYLTARDQLDGKYFGSQGAESGLSTALTSTATFLHTTPDGGVSTVSAPQVYRDGLFTDALKEVAQ